MLQLQTKSVNILRISKLLVKYNIKASVTNQTITLEGDISDDLLNQLCDAVDVISIKNFKREEDFSISEEKAPVESKTCIESIENKTVEEPKKIEIPQTEYVAPKKSLEYDLEKDLLYPEVRRGEVYWCDFGESYGCEQGGLRPAIVVQNNYGNKYSYTTIVLPCTTTVRKDLPVHYRCTFSSLNMIDYNEEKGGLKEENTVMTEQIRTVDKVRLRGYIGKLTPEIMKEIQGKIDISLNLSRKVKRVINPEKTIIDTPISISNEKMVVGETKVERKDVNMAQIELLSLVDIKKLLEISQSSATDEIRAQEILELFGFDLNKIGVKYLLKAIITSPKDSYYNLETLSEAVSKEESVDKEEVKRLIIARIKERFNFKKTPTIDFIRLINNFLLKRESKHEETNF